MKLTSARLFSALWPALALALLLWGSEARAGILATLRSTTVGNYTGYVVDADAADPGPGTDRDVILASSSVRFDKIGGAFSETRRFQSSFNLLAETGALVLLDLGGGITGTAVTAIHSITLTGATTPTTENLTAALKPAAQLDPQARYRVRLALAAESAPNSDVFNAVGNLAEPNPRSYIHFTNDPAVSDVPWHVVAQLDPVSFQRRVIIRSVAGQERFYLAISGTLYRYDDSDVPPATANVPVRVKWVLEDLVAGSLGLVETETLLSVPIASYAAGGPNTPATASFQVLAPLELPDWSVLNPSHVMAGTGIAEWSDFDATVIPIGTSVTPPAFLLALSGRLVFAGLAGIQSAFSEITGDPTAGLAQTAGDPNPQFATSLEIPAGKGTLPRAPGFTFGRAAPIPVIVFGSTGDALFAGGLDSVEVTPPVAGGRETVQGVRIERIGMSLSENGLRAAALGVYFPSGLSFRYKTAADVAAYSAERTRSLGLAVLYNVDLGPDGLPTLASFPLAPADLAELWVTHESLPVRFQTPDLRWVVGDGSFRFTPFDAVYVRKGSLNGRLSNDGYFDSASARVGEEIVVRPRPGGGSTFDGAVDFKPGAVAAHFPKGLAATFNGGTLKLIAGAIATAESGLTTDGTPVSLSYSRACQNDACGPAAAPRGILSLTPATQVLGQPGWAFTPDGGLRTGGPVAPGLLQFGGTAPTIFAHETTSFPEGSALIAGHQLSALALTPDVPDASRPAALLFSGHGSPSDAALIDRPGTAAYFDGLADYPGFNFRTGADGAVSVSSRLGGTVIGPYPLRDFSKFYARPGGVSGLQQAVLGSLPGSFPFYGFTTQIDNLRLSFLDSSPHESRTDGAIQIPNPPTANPPGAGPFFSLAFQRLLFSCSGQLLDARLADTSEKTLLYWGLRFNPISLRFATPEGCSPVVAPGGPPAIGSVVLGVYGNLSPLIPQRLAGELGFRPNGDLLTAQVAAGLGIKGVDSRLTLPTRINIKGAGTKDFALTPCTKVYLSSYDPATPDGFVNFAGTLKVPFFDVVKVHIHARGAGGDIVQIMGGWPSDPNAGPGQGWNVGGNHFFNDAKFDAGNIGRPAGVTLAAYRNGQTAQYHPVTHRKWLSGIAFDYPLSWNGITRSFTSFGADSETDIFLFRLRNRLKYLSAAGAEVTFGAQFEGLPNINMQQLFNDQLDRSAGGAFSSLESAANEALQDAAKAVQLVAAVEALDRLVSDQISTLLDAPLDAALVPAADAIYEAIKNSYDPALLPDLQQAAIGNALNPATMEEIDLALDRTLNAGGQVHDEIDDGLKKAIAGVDAALDFIKKNPKTDKREALIKIAEKLVKSAGIAGQVAGAAIQSLVDEYLPKADALFAAVESGLRPLRGSLVQIRASLSQAGGLLERFRAALEPELKAQCRAALAAHYGSLRDETGRYFLEVSPESVKKTIRGVIKKQFFASGTPVQWQGLLRLGVGEAKGIFRAQLDAMFGQLSQELRSALTPHLAGLDNSPIDAVGHISNALKGAKFDGTANINGEALSKLRVNAELQLRLGAGNDAAADSGGGMKFSGFYEASELESDSPPIGCLKPSQARAQVTVHAEIGKPGGALGGVSSLALEGSALFDNTGDVLGLQGSVTLGAGLNVKNTSLPGMSLDLALGEQGYYLLGRAKGKFKVVEADCAIFIGTTCDVVALKFIDPDTTRLLGDMGLNRASTRFTGFYLNAVGAISLNTLLGVPDTCIFSAKLKAGFGQFAVFYKDEVTLQDKFALGYRQLGGLSGTVLCGLDVEAELAIIGAASVPLPINDTSLVDSLNGLALDAQGRVTAKLTAFGEEVLSEEVIIIAHLSADGGISFSADY